MSAVCVGLWALAQNTADICDCVGLMLVESVDAPLICDETKCGCSDNYGGEVEL